jgi:hypothetical protein
MTATYGLLMFLALATPCTEHRVTDKGPFVATAEVGDIIIISFPAQPKAVVYGPYYAGVLSSTHWNWYMGPTEAVMVTHDVPRQLYGGFRPRTLVLRCVKAGRAHAEWSLTGAVANSDQALFREGCFDFHVTD